MSPNKLNPKVQKAHIIALSCKGLKNLKLQEKCSSVDV